GSALSADGASCLPGAGAPGAFSGGLGATGWDGVSGVVAGCAITVAAVARQAAKRMGAASLTSVLESSRPGRRLPANYGVSTQTARARDSSARASANLKPRPQTLDALLETLDGARELADLVGEGFEPRSRRDERRLLG